MTSQKRRAAGRRRAWGRGPIILRFEPLEGRQLLTATTPASPLPDLVGADFATAHALDWSDAFHAVGTILNQGDAPAAGAFNVEVFASTTPTVGPNSVPLGEITIPAGLGPNQTSKFDQVFSLPPTAIPDFSSGSPIYIALWVDPEKQIPESNDRNNLGVGQGFDISPVTITPHQPSLLVGSALGLSTTQATWGQTVTVTAQIRNNAQGDAPATRARIVLTPNGLGLGSAYDFTVGYLNIPAIPAWQTVNISQQITLPATPPSALNGGTQFSLSMGQDADFLTDPLFPHLATQGNGLDVTPITITSAPASATATPQATAPLPDLAPSNVVVPTKPVFWGYDFQVSTTIQNLGQADSGPVDVEFLLTGANGSLTNAIFLGKTTLPGLAMASSQDITQTVHLPNKLPNGVTLPSTEQGRISVLVDPDHTLDQTLRSNDHAESVPITLRVLGTDGTSKVPTSPPAGTSLGQVKPAGTVHSTTTTTTTPSSTTTAAPAADTVKAAKLAKARKLRRQVAAPHQSLTSKIEHQLKVFPTNVKNFFNDVIGNNDKKVTKVKKKVK